MEKDLLSKKFSSSTGISLEKISEEPELLKRYFSIGFSKKQNAKSMSLAGRGYPFFDKEGVDAEEKDKQNLEILRKW